MKFRFTKPLSTLQQRAIIEAMKILACEILNADPSLKPILSRQPLTPDCFMVEKSEEGAKA